MSTRRKFLGSIGAITVVPLIQPLPLWKGLSGEAFWQWFEERFLGDLWPFRDLINDPWAILETR
jgi:hypothetical protein